MMFINRLVRPLLLGVLVSITLTGCLFTSGSATQFYVLNPDPDAAVLSSNDQPTLSVEITSLRLPPYLERTNIVTRSSNNQLHRSDYHRWGGNLRKNLLRVLARNLSIHLKTPRVVITPHSLPAGAEYHLEIEVLQFERNSEGQVELSAHWQLAKGRDLKPVHAGTSQFRSEAIQPGDDYRTTVTAMADVFARLSEVIAQAILDIDKAG